MKKLYAFVTAVLVAVTASADDAWLLTGSAVSVTGTCSGVRWQAATTLHNRTDATVTVRLVEVSEGNVLSAPVDITIPPREYRRITGGTFGVAHIDAPNGVGIDPRLEYYTGENLCSPTQPPALAASGKLHVPLVRALTPPLVEQAHYGTDLGAQTVRLNVTMYNGGSSTAVAVVTLHRPTIDVDRCPATKEQSRTISIPARTAVQLALGKVTPCSVLSNEYDTFVTVTIDQPSFSFVSVLSDTAVPGATAATVE